MPCGRFRRLCLRGMKRLAPSLLIACLVLSTGCTAPAFNESQYRSKVAKAAEDAVSPIETVRLALGSALDDRLPSNPIDVAVADQEDVLSSVSGTFAGVQPPTEEMVELRKHVLDLLDKAESDVEDARIAYRLGDLAAVRAALDEMAPVAKQLDSIATRY
jgi:hypothetical protein